MLIRIRRGTKKGSKTRGDKVIENALNAKDKIAPLGKPPSGLIPAWFFIIKRIWKFRYK